MCEEFLAGDGKQADEGFATVAELFSFAEAEVVDCEEAVGAVDGCEGCYCVGVGSLGEVLEDAWELQLIIRLAR